MRGLEGRSATGGHLDSVPQRGAGPRGGSQNIHWPTGQEGEATPVTALAGWDVTAEELALAGAMGASGGRVYSVALGDLDHDGDLDIVSGSDSGEDYEIIAWRNRTSECCAFVPLAAKK